MKRKIVSLILAFSASVSFADQASDMKLLEKDCSKETDSYYIGNCHDDQAQAYYRLEKYDESFQSFVLAFQYKFQYKREKNSSPYFPYYPFENLIEKTKRYSDAVKVLSQFISENPTDADLYYKRYSYYLKTGDKPAALKDLEKYAQLYSGPSGYNTLASFYKDTLSDMKKALEALNRGVSSFYGKAEAYSNRAYFHYYNTKDYSACIQDYSEAIRIDPKSSSYYSYRANCYKNRGDKPSALKDMEKYAQLYNDPYGYRQLADFYRDDMKDLDGALKVLDKAVQLYPSKTSPYDYRGYFYKEYKKDYDSCIKDYSKAIELKADAYDYYDDRAGCYAKKGDKKAALKDWERYAQLYTYGPYGYKYLSDFYKDELKDMSGALSALNQGVTAFPGKTESYSNRASFYSQHQKDYAACASDYGQAISIDPKSSSYYSYRAECLLKQGDKQSALRDMEKYAELYGSPGGYSSLSSFHREKMSDLEGALSALDKAVQAYPDNLDSYSYRGQFYLFYLKDYDSCIADYTEAIRLKPDSYSYYDDRAACLLKKGDKASALKDWEKYAELYGSPGGYSSLADFYRKELKDNDRALNTYNLTIQKFPNNADSYANRGYFHRYYSKDYDSCVSDYSQAIRLNPSYYSYYDYRAACLIEKGDKASALKDREKYAELYGSPYGYSNLASFYRDQLSDMEGALKVLAQGIEKYPQKEDPYGYRAAFHKDYTKDYKACIKDYSKAIDMKPEYYSYYGDRAECYVKRGDKKSALKDMEKYAQLYTYSIYGYKRLSDFNVKHLEDPSKALEALNRGIQAFPDKYDGYEYRAELQRKTLKNFDACIEDYSQAIRLDPSRSSLYQGRASCRAEKGDWEGRMADLLVTYKLAREGADPYYVRSPSRLLQQEFSRRGAESLGKALLDKSISLNAGGSYADEAYGDRADYFFKRGDFESAEQDYLQALTLDPEDSSHLYNLGKVYSRQGNREGVADICQKLKTLAKGKAYPAYRCGDLYLEELKDYGQAAKVYGEIFGSMKPEDTYSENVLFNRAKASLKKGDVSSAQKDSERLKEILKSKGKSQYLAYDLMAEIYEAENKLGKAMDELEEAEQYDANRKDKMAMLYLKTGKPEKALDKINAYLQEYPDSAEPYKKRSEIYSAMGKKAEAAADLQKSKLLDGTLGPLSPIDSQQARSILADSLLSLLRSQETPWREASAWFLAGFREAKVRDALIGALEDKEISVRKNALESLVKMKDPQITDILVQALQGPVSEMKPFFAKALIQVESPGMDVLLLGAMRDQNSSVRQSVVSEVSKVDSSEAMNVLTESLKDPAASVRSEALDGILRKKSSQTAVILVRAFQFPHSDLKPKMAVSLLNLSAAGDQLLLQAMKNQEAEVKKAVLEAVSKVRNPLATSVLMESVKDAEALAREAAVSALGGLREKTAVKALIAALKDPDPGVRKSAARALGEIKDAGAVEPLAYALQDGNAEVKAEVEKVLSSMGVSKGEVAEKIGRDNEALVYYSQDMALLSGKAKQAMREKIIRLALKMKPAPEVPEEARRQMIRGEAAFDEARTAGNYGPASKEYQKAADLAPWWPEAYYNLGVVLEAAKDYRGAADSFRNYLLAAPDVEGAEALKEKIYKLEYKAGNP